LHKTPVVFLGANYYTGLSGIRTLGRRGVRVFALDYDFSNAYGLVSRYVHRKVLCPNVNTHEQELVDFLIELASEFGVKPVLIPSHDAYAMMISRHSEILADYYLFHQNPIGLLEQIVDKKGLYNLACEHGMKMPLTLFPQSTDEDKEAAGQMTFPCLVKPSISHIFVKIFRKKTFVAADAAELYQALQRAREEKVEVMVQQLIPGFDDRMFVLDVFIDREGQATHTMTAQKIRQFPANFGSSTLTHQFPVPELVEPGVSFLKNIGYRGYCEFEFKRHQHTEEYYMIEINARLSTLNSLFDACGIEYTYIIYRDLTGNPVDPLHLNTHLNYAFYHFYEDFFAVRQYRRTKQLTWPQIIRPLLSHRKVYAVWALDDPLPVLFFLKLLLIRVWRKIFRLFGRRESLGK
jgi:D-aspartate ligase